MKDKDWNSALSGNEDWNATFGASEVFRNFVKISLAEEEEEENLKKESSYKSLQSVDDIINHNKQFEKVAYIMPHENCQMNDDEIDLGFVDIRTMEEKEAELKNFQNMIKEANLQDAERELGLDGNMFYISSRFTKGK